LNKRRGTLIILSGPSGSGKGTVLKNFFENYGDKNVKLSVSATTREPREGEIDGVNYFFISKTSFENARFSVSVSCASEPPESVMLVTDDAGMHFVRNADITS